MSSIVLSILMAVIVILAFINCFERPDYNLPLFVACLIIWEKQRVVI
jgi:uncharacterized Tic20 family protein